MHQKGARFGFRGKLRPTDPFRASSDGFSCCGGNLAGLLALLDDTLEHGLRKRNAAAAFALARVDACATLVPAAAPALTGAVVFLRAAVFRGGCAAALGLTRVLASTALVTSLATTLAFAAVQCLASVLVRLDLRVAVLLDFALVATGKMAHAQDAGNCGGQESGLRDLLHETVSWVFVRYAA